MDSSISARTYCSWEGQSAVVLTKVSIQPPIHLVCALETYLIAVDLVHGLSQDYSQTELFSQYQAYPC